MGFFFLIDGSINFTFMLPTVISWAPFDVTERFLF